MKSNKKCKYNLLFIINYVTPDCMWIADKRHILGWHITNQGGCAETHKVLPLQQTSGRTSKSSMHCTGELGKAACNWLHKLLLQVAYLP